MFNHTTLEHVYDFRTAFANLCEMTSDVLIVVVPFVQQMHGHYGDFWRFSPEAIVRMIEAHGLSVGYLSFNNQPRTSVYVFAIGVKNRQKWEGKLPFAFEYADPAFKHLSEPYAGCNIIPPSRWQRFRSKISKILRR